MTYKQYVHHDMNINRHKIQFLEKSGFCHYIKKLAWISITSIIFLHYEFEYLVMKNLLQFSPKNIYVSIYFDAYL